MAAKIRKDDEVILVTGSLSRGKGKRGKVIKVLGNKVLVEGLNLVTKHQKADQNSGKEGGLIRKEAYIDISNVAIFNPSTKKADRVGFKFEDSKKVRIFKSTGELIK
ncbi:MAG: 50S ribosomal protein L24 [Psittacicella sp.]